MGNVIHETVPVQVWADVDVGIAEIVKYLNTIPGVRTHSSCQGTLGEGGPRPYRPQVCVSWDTPETFARLAKEFDVSDLADHWCNLHPRESQTNPAAPGRIAVSDDAGFTDDDGSGVLPNGLTLADNDAMVADLEETPTDGR